MADPIQEWQQRFRQTTGGRAPIRGALTLADRIVRLWASAGTVAFKTCAEFDRAFRQQVFHLKSNVPFGPPLPDARQLLYGSFDDMVAIKVKTMGYGKGLRAGGTMSIEIVNGAGYDWKHVVSKIDAFGQPIPSNVITRDRLLSTPEGPRVLRANGNREEIMDHELVLDENASVNADAFANRGHFDFLPGFDPSGAASLRPT